MMIRKSRANRKAPKSNARTALIGDEKQLPNNLVWRKKEGLVAPINSLIEGSLKTMIYDSFYSQSSLDLFDRNEIDRLLKNNFERRENNSYKIYTLLCFLRWQEMFL